MVKIRYQLDAFAVSLEMGRYYLLDKHYFDTTGNLYVYGYIQDLDSKYLGIPS